MLWLLIALAALRLSSGSWTALDALMEHKVLSIGMREDIQKFNARQAAVKIEKENIISRLPGVV